MATERLGFIRQICRLCNHGLRCFDIVMLLASLMELYFWLHWSYWYILWPIVKDGIYWLMPIITHLYFSRRKNCNCPADSKLLQRQQIVQKWSSSEFNCYTLPINFVIIQGYRMVYFCTWLKPDVKWRALVRSCAVHFTIQLTDLFIIQFTVNPKTSKYIFRNVATF